MRAIRAYLKVVFPHSPWLTLPAQRTMLYLSLYSTLVFKDGFSSLPWVVQGPGQAGESGIQLKLSMDFDCSILQPQTKSRSPNTNLTLDGWVRGGVLNHLCSGHFLVRKALWKEISGKKPLVNWARCWRHWWRSSRAPAPLWAGLVRGCCFTDLGCKSGFPTSFAFPLSLWCYQQAQKSARIWEGKE